VPSRVSWRSSWSESTCRRATADVEPAPPELIGIHTNMPGVIPLELFAGTGMLADGHMYQLVHQREAVRDRMLEVTFLEPDAEAYSFTFG
jgi:hypothetical protein